MFYLFLDKISLKNKFISSYTLHFLEKPPKVNKPSFENVINEGKNQQHIKDACQN